MKRTLQFLPLLLLAGCVTRKPPTDITVKSDLGEKTVVKKSAVTSYQFDLVNADSHTRKWLNVGTKGRDKCASGILSWSKCDEIYGDGIYEKEENLKTIKSMPDITVVKYRTIDTNVNGDKTASGYKYVACIPEGEDQERVKWAELINDIDGVNANPKKKIGNNLLNDGLVASSVQIKVCEKYGNI